MTYFECIEDAKSHYISSIGYRAVYALIGLEYLPRYLLTAYKNKPPVVECFVYDKFVNAFRKSKKKLYLENIKHIDKWKCTPGILHEINFECEVLINPPAPERFYDKNDLLKFDFKTVKENFYI